jgi:phosphoglycolate phosphatase-like HAD superfamily hydrolase
MDGVLADSKSTYAVVVQAVLRERGVSLGLEEVVDARVPHVPRWVDALVPTDHPEREALVASCATEVRARMPERCEEIPLADNAREILSRLPADMRKFVLTNSTSKLAHGILDRLGLWGLIEKVVSSDDGFGGKEEAIAHIVSEVGVPASQVTYCGDTDGDVKVARRAGCRSIILYTHMSWDHGKLEAILSRGADVLIMDLDDLPFAMGVDE